MRLLIVKKVSSSDLDTFENKMFEELKTAKNFELDVMVYRNELTFTKYIDVLDSNFIGAKTTAYT